MRFHLLAAIGIAGCLPPTNGASPGAAPRGASVMVSSEVCDLVEGRLDAWRGLAPFVPASAPACVGAEEKSEWLGFFDGMIHYRRYHRPSGEQVWLFDRDEKVVLVEVFPAARQSIDSWLDRLGLPERTVIYGLPQLLQRPLARGDEEVDELIWGARGLGLLRARAADGRERLVRVRGFAPMSADEYYRRFVRLPPIEYHEPH
jgi:hypothetical protein